MTRLLAIEGVLAPDVNFHDNFVGAATGPTALYWAVHFGNEELVRLLLDKGADPNLKDENGGHHYFMHRHTVTWSAPQQGCSCREGRVRVGRWP